jgi:hypothetical protein
MVAWNVPILLETDIHRYLWDGFVLSEGFNPYQFSPEEVLNARTGEGENLYRPEVFAHLQELAQRAERPEILTHLEQVNNPSIPTCYPPLTEFSFAVAARLSPGNEVVWKGLIAGVDCLLSLLIVALLKRLGRDPAWVLFYAWCPLPIKEYANTGHFDPLATLLTVLAVLALMDRRAVLGGLALGAGISAKVYPLVLLPTLWRRLGWRGILAASIAPVLFLSPFLGIGLHVFDGLMAFAKEWEFNSSLFAMINSWTDALEVPSAKFSVYFRLTQAKGEVLVGDYLQEIPLDGFLLAKLVTGGFLLGLLGLLVRWKEDADWSVPGRVLVALAGLLLLSPVTDPWYLPWLLPYACLFPALSWLYLSGSIVNYYAYFLEWRYLWWHRPVEYFPFYLLLIREIYQHLTEHPSFLRGSGSEEVPSLGADADSQGGCATPVDGSKWL